MLDRNGFVDRNWAQFFEALLARIGGAGDVTALEEVAVELFNTPPPVQDAFDIDIYESNIAALRTEIARLRDSITLGLMDTMVTPVQKPRDFFLEVSRGRIPGMSAVQKFGRTTNADAAVATDAWDRANATDNQAIWVAPTAARIHQIVSASASDDGDPAGVGAQTIRIWGLTGWDAEEVSEDIILNGTTDVPTVNAYVIIHRMKAMTWGSSGPNVGNITATADTDATVTAMILAGLGQTRMAIYGFPSTQTLYIEQMAASIDSASAAGVKINIRLLENPIPDSVLTGFIRSRTFAVDDNGTSEFTREFDLPLEFPGPHIIKLEVLADKANTDASASFSAVLVDN